ncbi:MAG: hypothetical protein ACQEW2_09720 [Bacillota bacterium]
MLKELTRIKRREYDVTIFQTPEFKKYYFCRLTVFFDGKMLSKLSILHIMYKTLTWR